MSKANLAFEKVLPRGRYKVFQTKPEMKLVQVKQTHTSIVLHENSCLENENIADAILGNSSTPFAILTADCLPVLILGEKDHALVHAGWRGLQNGILLNNLIKKSKPFYAFIGPHISVLNYEVQPDFKVNFAIPEAFVEKNGKLFFSLSVVARIQLESAYPGIVIEESGLCTYSDLRFHSYRRDKTTQRNWNIYIP